MRAVSKDSCALKQSQWLGNLNYLTCLPGHLVMMPSRAPRACGTDDKKKKLPLNFSSFPLQVPLQRKLIDMSMLTEEEINWVDAYHAKVWRLVSPLLQKGVDPEDATYLQKLEENCRPLRD